MCVRLEFIDSRRFSVREGTIIHFLIIIIRFYSVGKNFFSVASLLEDLLLFTPTGGQQ